MDDDEILIQNSTRLVHPNVIIHIDVDYFYAQVEENSNPQLKNKPVGIKQRFHIVTCNYIARSFGVKKMELINDALRKCPDLIVINGEDLSNYKAYSKRLAELLHTVIGPSERMGLDEHFIDISKQVDLRLSTLEEKEVKNLFMTGPFYPSEGDFKECTCGCEQRLIVGSKIAEEIREKIFKDLKLTCSVGIAHNKLLAKLVGQINKPDNQTTLAPTAATTFMLELKDIHKITGIGSQTASRFEELGIFTIADLQNVDTEILIKKFGADMSARYKNMALGIDSSDVKPSGKPKTVGLEDSCRPISIRSDAQEKFRTLLLRLVTQIQEDGRVPQSLKVTVRKYDPFKKRSFKETRQFSLLSSHFRCVEGKIQLASGADSIILKNIMILFDRMVNLSLQFNITLLGLCFSKFQNQKRGTGSIASFLMKKQDVEVQSITNLSNENINGTFSESFRSKTANVSPSSSVMDYETMSNNSLDFSGSEESEFEPSPKKRKKLNLLFVAKSQRCSSTDDVVDVSALHLSGGSMDTADGLVKASSTPNRVISPLCINNDAAIACCSKSPELPDVDRAVWLELPLDVQRELITSWKPSTSTLIQTNSKTSTHSKSKPTLHKYFIRNS